MKTRVRVTAARIKRARKLLKSREHQRSFFCPVALALKAINGDLKVSVGTYNFSIDDGHTTKDVDLPENIQKWIRRFDVGRRVKPMSFTLDI